MKNFITIIIALIFYNLCYAQIIDFPDINFKNALIEQGIDTDNDGEIQVSEAGAVINLNVNNYEILSLEGIEYFINIEELQCFGNQLSTLNFSENVNLATLKCWNNQLTGLDVSQNLNLVSLSCWNNQLTELDVTQNINLVSLIFDFNFITEIDLTQNLNLESLGCSYNVLAMLDVTQLTNLINLGCNNNLLSTLSINNGNNHNMLFMNSMDNTSLFCIQVDYENATYPVCEAFPVSGWCKDETTIYSEDCSLGITDQNLHEAVQLYPNPVKNILQISTKNNLAIKSIQVFDVMGKQLVQVKSSNQIDVSRLPAGLLFVKIETENGFVVKKVVKEY